MEKIHYKGRGEHSVNQLEKIIEQQAEEIYQRGQEISSLRKLLEMKDELLGVREGVIKTLKETVEVISKHNPINSPQKRQ